MDVLLGANIAAAVSLFDGSLPGARQSASPGRDDEPAVVLAICREANPDQPTARVRGREPGRGSAIAEERPCRTVTAIDVLGIGVGIDKKDVRRDPAGEQALG